MKGELKKCPFCGGKAGIIIELLDGTHTVSCRKCNATTSSYKTEKRAINAWNRRVDDGK